MEQSMERDRKAEEPRRPGRPRNTRDADRLQAAATLAIDNVRVAVLDVLHAAREHLELDIAYFSHFTATEQIVRDADGDVRSFGLEPGTAIPLEDTHCQRVLAGLLPNVVPDTESEPRAGDMPSIGSYVGVPVHFSDGRLYGTLCCAGRQPAPWLSERDASFLRVLARLLSHQLEREELERRCERYRVEADATGALLAALDARDSYTGMHSQAVVELAAAVAGELGLDDVQVAEVRQVAMLHDVGKIGIPDAVLGKPGALDPDEWALMKRHSVIGADIVSSIASLSHLAPAVRAEHERWDGLGYPDGLVRDQIPLTSRIAFACDAFHAMTSTRPYRCKMGRAAAARELEENAGTQFDADVVDALLRVVRGR